MPSERHVATQRWGSSVAKDLDVEEGELGHPAPGVAEAAFDGGLALEAHRLTGRRERRVHLDVVVDEVEPAVHVRAGAEPVEEGGDEGARRVWVPCAGRVGGHLGTPIARVISWAPPAWVATLPRWPRWAPTHCSRTRSSSTTWKHPSTDGTPCSAPGHSSSGPTTRPTGSRTAARHRRPTCPMPSATSAT